MCFSKNPFSINFAKTNCSNEETVLEKNPNFSLKIGNKFSGKTKYPILKEGESDFVNVFI